MLTIMQKVIFTWIDGFGNSGTYQVFSSSPAPLRETIDLALDRVKHLKQMKRAGYNRTGVGLSRKNAMIRVTGDCRLILTGKGGILVDKVAGENVL